MIRYRSDRLRPLLAALLESQSRLASLAQMSFTEFMGNPHYAGSARYHLIAAAEGIVDIAHHLIAQNRWRSPETYGEAVQILGEHQVVPFELSQRLAGLIRLRNRLVDRYWETDDREVFQIIPEALRDIEISFRRSGRPWDSP
ncbi:MAG: type VII toxin-antitoxin system HepT family RNase toxin [Thermoflexus sp.]